MEPAYAEAGPEPSGHEKIELGISEYKELENTRPVDKSVTSLDRKEDSKSTTDHSRLKELQGPFTSGPEVTRACLECHNKAGHQFTKNKHWTWLYTNPDTGQQLGKGVLINNFCTNARGNEGMCAQCHAGYNMTDMRTYDFSNEENIDCLICHESTGTYYKMPPTSGNKACSVMFQDKPAIDLVKVAQSVELPGRNNCGACHFFGGGGDNVKHGDLSSVLFHPPREVDVHMSEEGENFSCVICHVGEGHEWAGSRYTMEARGEAAPGKPGMPRETAGCESCHGSQPHPLNLVGLKLNHHTDRIACETCHIPTFARGGVATKIDWDWRTAGKLKNGEGFKLKNYTQGDGHHRATYKSIKGDFKYGENLVPEYRWFNGEMVYTLIDTKFDPSNPVDINHVEGSADDPKARITPFKRMHTVQPYDKGNNTLVYMHLWGDDPDAFWGNYSFARAIDAGMAKENLPYSGDYGFIDTYSYWPINHMVAPKEQALDCAQCHSADGRMQEIDGVYLPGRDSNRWLDIIGLLALAGTLLGVLGHGLIRKLANKGGQH
jgi:octaheme c-type cytochrome (tetrathionate reductase family)